MFVRKTDNLLFTLIKFYENIAFKLSHSAHSHNLGNDTLIKLSEVKFVYYVIQFVFMIWQLFCTKFVYHLILNSGNYQ